LSLDHCTQYRLLNESWPTTFSLSGKQLLSCP
jgi:hypothetical protein